MELFKIKNLTYFYPEGKISALERINISIDEGDFILIEGPSGGGKTTLARFLGGFIPDFYGGNIEGEVYFKDKLIFEWDRKEIHKQIGMVFQNPEKQIIMGEVERDLAFGLENLGVEPKVMVRRINETLNFLGLIKLKKRLSNELSSGEKQKIAIGSILAMMPRVLILDEPSSQLDPAAAEEIFGILRRLNQEHGFTIILIEQRLERCFHLANRVLLIDNGMVVYDKAPRTFSKKAARDYNYFVPSITRFFASRGFSDIPLNVSEARKLMNKIAINPKKNFTPKEITENLSSKKDNAIASQEHFISLKNIKFSYNNSTEVLKNINLNVNRAEFLSILGENGAGKSTLLKIIAGILKPQQGKIMIGQKQIETLSNKEKCKKIGYLSQDPNDYLFNDTVEQELMYTIKNLGIDNRDIIKDALESLNITNHRYSYPRDLSTGERQRVALGTILVTNPSLVILDEPTRGLDCFLKKRLGEFLRTLIEKNGVSVILVTQDVEFAAEFSQRVILLSEGRIIEDGNKFDVFHGNLFYSTQINKLFNGIVDNIITSKQAEKVIAKKEDG